MPRVILLSLLVLWGCASGGADPVMLRDAPPDLAMDVLVFEPIPAEGGRRTGSRFVLEADGVLRAELDVQDPRRSYPAHTRRLTPEQISGLWRLIAESDLLDPQSPGAVAAPAVYRPAPNLSVALFTVRFAGETRSFRAMLGRADPDAERAGEIIARLRRLAWAS